MGNLLFDCKLKPEGQGCALFRIHLSTCGITKIEIIPTQALIGHTVLAGPGEAQIILAEMNELCSTLGTDLKIDEDIEGRPVGVVDIAKPTVTPRSKPVLDPDCVTFPAKCVKIPAAISQAALTGNIPEDANKVIPPAEPAPGLELLAYKLPESTAQDGILYLSTWWRVTRKVNKNTLIAFHISPKDETPRRGTPWYTRHDPADWTAPLSLLKPGQIVEDRYPARLAGLPPGQCKIYAVALDTTRDEKDRILGKPCYLGNIDIVAKVNK